MGCFPSYQLGVTGVGSREDITVNGLFIYPNFPPTDPSIPYNLPL